MKRRLTEVRIDRIAAVDFPCQEGAVMTIMKRDESGDNKGRTERIEKLKKRITDIKRKALLHAEIDALQKRLDRLTMKFDENEPRDKDGKWTSGGGGGGDKGSYMGTGGKDSGLGVKTPGFQHRHYEVIANALTEHGNPDTAQHFANNLRATNASFAESKSMSWATGNKTGRASRSDSASKTPMSRQHYNFLAEKIRTSGDSNKAKLAETFARHLGAAHSGFKPEHFIARASGDAKARKRAIQQDLADFKASVSDAFKLAA